MRVNHAVFQNQLRFVGDVMMRARRRQINYHFDARIGESAEIGGRGLARREQTERNL